MNDDRKKVVYESVSSIDYASSGSASPPIRRSSSP